MTRGCFMHTFLIDDHDLPNMLLSVERVCVRACACVFVCDTFV